VADKVRPVMYRPSKDEVTLTMSRFWDAQCEWSQEKFGSDDERGPRGPLLHLKKEIDECLDNLPAALDSAGLPTPGNGLPKLHKEIVDAQFLVFDAARRSGMSFAELLVGCFSKLSVNEHRLWQTPTSDAPVEHVREDGPHDRPKPHLG